MLSLTRPIPARFVLRPMTKILNPLVRKAAGRKHIGWVAQIHHTGGKSGRAYTTPAGARQVGDSIVVPLTFGTGSDWVRNIVAAGGCTIRWKAHDYTTTSPSSSRRTRPWPAPAERSNRPSGPS